MALNYKSSLVRYRRYLQQMQDKSAWQAGIFVIASLLLVIAMLLFALRPTLITIAQLMGQIREERELSVKLANKINILQQAVVILEKQRDRLPLLDEAIPDDQEWARWVRTAQGIATNSGLSLDNVKVVPAVSTATSKNSRSFPNGVQSLGFDITVSGRYENLKEYVKNLEKMRRVVWLTEATISRDKDSGKLTLVAKGIYGYGYKFIQP